MPKYIKRWLWMTDWLTKQVLEMNTPLKISRIPSAYALLTPGLKGRSLLPAPQAIPGGDHNIGDLDNKGDGGLHGTQVSRARCHPQSRYPVLEWLPTWPSHSNVDQTGSHHLPSCPPQGIANPSQSPALSITSWHLSHMAGSGKPLDFRNRNFGKHIIMTWSSLWAYTPNPSHFLSHQSLAWQ